MLRAMVKLEDFDDYCNACTLLLETYPEKTLDRGKYWTDSIWLLVWIGGSSIQLGTTSLKTTKSFKPDVVLVHYTDIVGLPLLETVLGS